MKAYRYSINLKLGLVAFALLIAAASLVYTNRVVERLRAREQFIIQLWASAQEQLAQVQVVNPYLDAFQELDAYLAAAPEALPPAQRAAFREALGWAMSMPPAGEVTLASEIVRQASFDIPAIITDSTGRQPFFWRNVGLPDTLTTLAGLPPADSARIARALIDEARAMAATFPPIAVEQDFGTQRLRQYIHYGESSLVKELRWFPYIQLLFVGLFVLAGYAGFSYVRRSEQRSLWVGMAKEAAHQLGTPISSLMGWLELLRLPGLPAEQEALALDEVENDIQRLRRVANRFSDIGSLPKLDVMAVAPVVEATADYMRRRLPQQGKRVSLTVAVPPELRAPLNAELFEWVVENLIKNAIDAIETHEGRIELVGRREDGRVVIDVRDTGKGIDRRQRQNIFRPGYSTKKRGWGLGLSLAKRIVEDYHRGTLTLAHSRVGQGSTFRIELPAA